MKVRPVKTPDELLERLLYIMDIDIDSLQQEAEVGALEPDRARILVAYQKGVVELQREIRQSLKDIDPKKLSDEEFKRELEKYQVQTGTTETEE